MDVEDEKANPDVEMSNGDEEKQWVSIVPLNYSIDEPQIMKLLNPFMSSPFKLADPSMIYIQNVGKFNKCRLKLQSADGARAFVNKFDGFAMENNGGKTFRVELASYQPADQSGSARIKLTNLVHGVTSQQLTQYIAKECKVKPELVVVHQHSLSDYSSYALVEMKCADDAQKVVTSLRMKEWKGQHMWARQIAGNMLDRNIHFKGSVDTVIIMNVPVGTTREDVEQWCGLLQVSSISIPKYTNGYIKKECTITMANERDASAVFDGLNGKVVKGLTLRTRFVRKKKAAKKADSFQSKLEEIKSSMKKKQQKQMLHYQTRIDQLQKKVQEQSKYKEEAHLKQQQMESLQAKYNKLLKRVSVLEGAKQSKTKVKAEDLKGKQKTQQIKNVKVEDHVAYGIRLYP